MSAEQANKEATYPNLDAQCNAESIAIISTFPFNWKEAGIKLLGHEVFCRIEKELLVFLSEEEKKKKILHMWVENERDRATNRVLQQVLQSVMENNTEVDAKKAFDNNKDYYTIVLLGKTGQGKSYTGNKLLGYGGSKNPVIKEWSCKDDRGLLKKTEAGKELKFMSSGSSQSVTEKCQMLSNEETCVRVLDVPGFGDSKPQLNLNTNQVNAKFVNAIIEVQKKMNITYNRILFFLPFRGSPERADAYFQDELKMLFHYFGTSIFNCMVIIATQEKRYQKFPFGPEDIDQLATLTASAMKQSTGIETIESPPIIYLSLNASPEEVLMQIQTAKILNDSVLGAQQNLPIYNGEDNWEQWIARFEVLANQQFKNNDAAKLQWFKGHLSDEMKKMCLKFCHETDTYKAVRAKVEEELYSKIFCLKDIEEAYSGEGDETSWERWIEHFEKKTSQRKLNDVRKLQWLQSRLINKANDTINALPSHEKKSYIKTKEALQKQVYLRCFDQRGKKSEEDLRDYAEALKKLATNAYPGMPMKEIERMILLKLNCHLHHSIQSLEFKSVDEALSINYAVNEIKEPFTSDRCEKWDTWHQKFDSKCKECKLDQREYLLWFECRLSGKAKDCYRSIPELQRKDYEVAKNALQIQLYKNSFEDKCNISISRESVDDLAEELSWLAKKAFSDIPQRDRDRKIIEGILNATKSSFNLQPETVKEACYFVKAIHRIPDVFTGTKDWHQWICTAEGYLSDQTISMDAHEKVRCIHTRMSGIALELFQSLLCEKTSSFQEAIQSFEKKLFQHWLTNRKREKSEGWDTYVDDMSSLARRINAPDDLIYQHIMTQVVDHSRCKTLQEAVNALMANELVSPYRNTEESDWKKWREKFELVMNEHCRGNQEKVTFLSNSLADDALKAYEDFRFSVDTDYSTAIDALEKELYMRKFKSRNKKPFETWDALHEKLCALAFDCYDNPQDREDAVLRQVQSIIRERGIVLCAKPFSAKDAVFIISAQEALPTTYSGAENWEEWIKRLSHALVQCKITNDAAKLKFLQLRLTGEALKFFSSVFNESIQYNEVVDLLEVNFYKERLKNRSKLPGETWQQFADDLYELGSKAKETEKIDEFVLGKIFSDKSIGKKVSDEHPKSVSDAIIIARAKETIEETFSGDIDLWDKWIERFESKAENNCLNEYEKLLWFRVSLARNIRNTAETYDCAKQALETTIFRQAFENKRKETYESFKHLATTLQSYAMRAFPGDDAEMLALKRLKEIMQNKNLDYDRLPLSTLDEAVTTFTALEEMHYKQYKSSDDWELWLCEFDKTAERNQLDDRVKVKWLKACVTGTALSMFSTNLESPDFGFTLLTEKISLELKIARENARLSLLSCTKCSEKGNHHTCHTEMVYSYELEYSIWYVWGAFKQYFTNANKVCKKCKKELGTPGCSIVGSIPQAKHDCT